MQSRFARPARLASVGLGLVAFLAACGGNTSTSGPLASGPAASAPTGSGTAASAAAGTVAVEAKDFAFTPSSISVPAGEVTFQVRNAGSQEHEFEIFQGDVVKDEVEGILPGQTKDLTVSLAAGEYTFKCLVNGHDQLGMTGTLTVTGS